MKLFYKAGACSLSPHIVLCEAKLDFTLEKVDLATKKTETGADFLTINPKGQVPTLLLDEGTVLTEGAAIVQYIADKAPLTELLAPVGNIKRYQTIAWLNYIATELHKSFVPLFRPNFSEEQKANAIQDLLKKFTYVNSQLAGKRYLLGDNFTVADAYLFTVLRWGAVFHYDVNQHPEIKRYLQQVAERPAVSTALAAEGLK